MELAVVTRFKQGQLFRSIIKSNLVFKIALALLVIHLFVAITGPLWAPYSPTEFLVGTPYSSPSSQHLLGTDKFGRDVFSRVVYGERLDLTLALSIAGLAIIVGTVLGLMMGYLRGSFDEIFMRITEILISIPPLILSLVILSSIGNNTFLMVLTVAFFYIPRVATVIRAATLDIVTEDFVTIAKLRGESVLAISVRELLPNILPIVFAEFSLRTGFAIIFVGGLGFLGFGVAPPTPEWGLMINEGREFITAAPWAVLAPSFAMATLVIALSLFTEAINEKSWQEAP